MSSRPNTRGQQSTNYNPGDEQLSRPTTSAQYAPPTTSTSSVAASPSWQRGSGPSQRGFELPPLPQSATVSGGSFPSSPSTRLAGVSSILNPIQTHDGNSSRRRKASELEGPGGYAASLPPLATAPQSTAAAPNRPESFTTYSPFPPGDRPGRRVLTPRSPSLHRAASLGQLQPASATISAQQTPFPASPRQRTYAIEPGRSGAPPLPTPPAIARPNYGFGPTPSSEAARRASGGIGRGRAPSGSASPSTSYSSYSQAEQTSPASQFLPTTALSGPYSASEGGSGAASAPPSAIGSERQRPIGIPISSSGGQNVYQMMTLETTSGTVQLPVDVQAASRVADEKRRRNAGASARFRQRRKEKEKEASTTITKLEQQVKELGEDADYYKRERDYLANALLAAPGGGRHFPRPPSPRARRSSIAMPGPSGASGAGYGGAHEMPRSPEQSRNVRRRTSTMSLPPPPPHTALPPQGAPFPPGYGPQVYGSPFVPQSQQHQQQVAEPHPSPMTRVSLPASAALPSMHDFPPPGPPQLMQAPPQTGPYNPYAAERRPPGASGPREGR